MLNKIILIGRLATDPELKYTPSGIAVTNFRIAVDRPFSKNAEGEKETDFIDVVTWRQTAEFAANYLNKGRLVAVDGRLQIRGWTANDGTKRRTAEVVAQDVRALDRPPTEGQPRRANGGDTDGDLDYRLPAAAGAAPEADFNDPFNDE